MKKIIASLFAFTCFILSATAQDKIIMKEHFIHHQKEMMIKKLDLTPQQQLQVKTNNENFKAQMIALNKDESITVKEFRDKKYSLRKEKKNAFLSILTPDQKTKLAQLKSDRKVKRDIMAAKKLDKMKTQLNLSDDQVASIKTNRQSTHDKIEAILQNDNLSRTDAQEQLMAIKTANKNSMQSVLTPDQYSKWKEMKKARMEKMQDRISERMNSGIAN